ncbi:hypothetical protein LOD99_8673 [Oopsacas minuta]|uniref:SCP domain-containing protein n=1 Tax=Oopsacas minuta TaxID=111878 RepID=A0AAV7JGM4_9METZ|nr:hypothetical protein LOD99_8673 [Oopsacas minuta]
MIPFWVVMKFLIFSIFVIFKLAPAESYSIDDHLIKTILVRAHNQLRREVQPQASNMKEISWSTSLQLLADYKVKDCKSSSLSLDYNGLTYGYASRLIKDITEPSITTFLTSVEEWFDSGQYYNMYDNECGYTPRVCENYVQVAWANSSQIGCAYNYCTIRNYESNEYYGVLILCLYYSAMDGDLPYISGDGCSHCPESAPYCNQGLCASATATDRPSDTPYSSNASVYKYNAWYLLVLLMIMYMFGKLY